MAGLGASLGEGKELGDDSLTGLLGSFSGFGISTEIFLYTN